MFTVLLYVSDNLVLNVTVKNKLKTGHNRIIICICGFYTEIDKESGIYNYLSITKEMEKLELMIYICT